MKKKKIFFLSLTAVAIYAVIFFIPEKNEKPEVPDTEIISVSNQNERTDYFASHGWEVEEIAGKDIVIPSEFSEAYEEYAVIQDKQGLPLREHAGKNARLYVYEVRNYSPENKKMLAELIVCEDTAIASMVYSEDGGSIRLSVS
ncbi:MAG: DUF4830 domain-containing protein [Ruminococcus flavefaciens]|nr:DUF4830 domain-containing protein [Ruminococcus flavefaciens]